MLLLKPAIGLFSWYAYSVVQRKGLEKGTYAGMQILSEMRNELGDASQIPSIGEKMKEASKDVNILDDDSWIPIAGDDYVNLSKDDMIIRVMNCNGAAAAADHVVACCYSQDGSKSGLFGRHTPSNKSLRELVSKKTQKLEIIEDIYERINWNSKISECKPLSEVGMASTSTTSTTSITTTTNTNIQGAYTFCYRDYVNHEEMLAMMGKRWGVERFLFKPARAEELIVAPDGSCTLTARAKVFGFLPLSIKWEGSIQQDASMIVWETTSMNMGFKRFLGQKCIDRPPAAEKLRKNPWHIKVPDEDNNGDDESSYGDILCFLREGTGHLVFGKDECLQQIASGSFGLRNMKHQPHEEPVLA